MSKETCEQTGRYRHCPEEATHINTMHDGSETHRFCEVHAIQHFQLYAQRKIKVHMGRAAQAPAEAPEPTAGEATQ